MDTTVIGLRTSRRFNLFGLLERYYRIVMTGPLFLLLAGFIVIPMLFVIYLSFHFWSPGQSPIFIGWENYRNIFLSDIRFRRALIHTLVILVAGLGGEMGFGVIFALLIHSREFRAKKMLLNLSLVPLLMPPVAAAILWKAIFHPVLGILNYILALFHLGPFTWSYSSQMAMGSLLFVYVWQGMPFTFLVALAGLSVLPKEPFEAAKIDGASSFQTIIHVTLPLLKPVLLIIMIFRAVTSFRLFGLFMALIDQSSAAARAVEPLYVYAYYKGFFYGDMSSASVIGVLIMFITVTLSIILLQRGRV